MAKIQDLDLPYLEFAEAAAPGTPAAAISRIYVKADGLFYSKDDAGVETLMSSGTSFTNPMTTAEDIIKGGVAGAPVRLPAGAAGGVMAMGNSAVIWNAGTSFPASKATNDRYWRTDLGMEFYWDGTRWLCTCPHRIDVSTQHALLTVSANNSLRGAPPSPITASVWWVSLDVGYHVVTTNDGSNFWTIAGHGGSVSTAASAPNTSLRATSAIGASATVASLGLGVEVSHILTGAPGVLYVTAGLTFRYIGT